MDLTITAPAEKFIRRVMRFGGAPDCGVRLVATAGGCSGLAVDFTVEPTPHAGDLVFERDGMRFFVSETSRMLLSGTTLDFADTPGQTGLIVHDPKARACGCGCGSGDALPGVASVAIASIGRRH